MRRRNKTRVRKEGEGDSRGSCSDDEDEGRRGEGGEGGEVSGVMWCLLGRFPAWTLT